MFTVCDVMLMILYSITLVGCPDYKITGHVAAALGAGQLALEVGVVVGFI